MYASVVAVAVAVVASGWWPGDQQSTRANNSPTVLVLHT